MSCQKDLCEVVQQSVTMSGSNSLQLVGKEDGTVIVNAMPSKGRNEMVGAHSYTSAAHSKSSVFFQCRIARFCVS